MANSNFLYILLTSEADETPPQLDTFNVPVPKGMNALGMRCLQALLAAGNHQCNNTLN